MSEAADVINPQGTEQPISARNIVNLDEFKSPGSRMVVSSALYGINWILKKEKIPNLPSIEYHFFYSPHGAPEDIQGLARPLSETDVFIPEAAGGGYSAYQCYTKVSQGLATPEEALKEAGQPLKPVTLAELTMLYKSKKVIVLADADPLDMAMLQRERPPLLQEDSDQSFEDRLIGARRLLEMDAEVAKAREVLMLRSLDSNLLSAINKNPDLKKKEKVKVLLQLGSGHTWISQVLSKAGQKVTREFSHSPHIYDFYDEAVRRIIFNQEVTDDLVARVVLRVMFGRLYREQLEALSTDYSKQTPFIKNFISRFSFEEIKAMFENVGPLNRDKFRDLFEEKFKENGMEFPKTPDALNKYIRTVPTGNIDVEQI